MCRVRIDSVSVSYFKTFFVPQIASVLNILETRLLPNLSKETLEAEADAKADESWEHRMRQPASACEEHEEPAFAFSLHEVTVHQNAVQLADRGAGPVVGVGLG